MAKVFISATSDDLAAARAVVKQGLLTINLEVVEQTDFEVDYGTMLQRLRRKIEGCDAMVQIAGFRYGGEPDPATLPPGTPRRSYTQWEYHLAKQIQADRAKKGKKFPIYALVTGVDFPAEQIRHEKVEDDTRQQLQLAHRALLNPEKNTVATVEELEKRSREVQVELERLRDELEGARRKLRLAIAALAALATPVLLIALGGGLADYGCKVPGAHSLCQHHGWGGVPTLAQEAEFATAADQGCDGLRRYLAGPAPERLRARAQAAIDARQVQLIEGWMQQPEVRESITLPEVLDPMPDEASANAASRARLLDDAEAQCTARLRISLYRMPAGRELVRLDAEALTCSPSTAGYRCTGTAEFICQADQLTETVKETCDVAP